MKNRLFALTAMALLVALVLPSSALAYDWTRSPVNPLVSGGVHSKAKFKTLMTSSNKVRSAVKGVIKADKYPSWVFAAAVKAAAAGNIHSATLSPGTHIRAMGFGVNRTHIVKNTVWAGKRHLPYYYVNASNAVTENGALVTTTYRVCLAKTCANPFVFGRRVARTAQRPTPVYNLYIEKRSGSTEGQRLGGWEVTGTVGAQSVDVQTTDTASTLVGQFAAGTAYSLSEVRQNGWVVISPVSPVPGNFSGTMPASDLTLVFVNGRAVD